MNRINIIYQSLVLIKKMYYKLANNPKPIPISHYNQIFDIPVHEKNIYIESIEFD